MVVATGPCPCILQARASDLESRRRGSGASQTQHQTKRATSSTRTSRNTHLSCPCMQPPKTKTTAAPYVYFLAFSSAQWGSCACIAPVDVCVRVWRGRGQGAGCWLDEVHSAGCDATSCWCPAKRVARDAMKELPDVLHWAIMSWLVRRRPTYTLT